MYISDYTRIFATADDLTDFLMLDVKEQDRVLAGLTQDGKIGGVSMCCRLDLGTITQVNKRTTPTISFIRKALSMWIKIIVLSSWTILILLTFIGLGHVIGGRFEEHWFYSAVVITCSIALIVELCRNIIRSAKEETTPPAKPPVSPSVHFHSDVVNTTIIAGDNSKPEKESDESIMNNKDDTKTLNNGQKESKNEEQRNAKREVNTKKAGISR